MVTALVVIFVVAYAAIALEHPLKVNKSASALIGAGLLWTVYAMMGGITFSFPIIYRSRWHQLLRSYSF